VKKNEVIRCPECGKMILIELTFDIEAVHSIERAWLKFCEKYVKKFEQEMLRKYQGKEDQWTNQKSS